METTNPINSVTKPKVLATIAGSSASGYVQRGFMGITVDGSTPQWGTSTLDNATLSKGTNSVTVTVSN